MSNLLIDQTIAQEILTYLTKQPYAEVYRFIPVLVQLQPAEVAGSSAVVPPPASPPPPVTNGTRDPAQAMLVEES